ncbi:hypothetical protein CP533_4056 [Ophiocordyceps camponoti-saundersi (nom. inval.)]|nr:hypothetical protein CP533_4056 [Ophiocordyceps camponoti-saundersi (nom. inval.)]
MKFQALALAAFSLVAGVLAEDMAVDKIRDASKYKLAIKCKILQAKGICGNPCRLKRGIEQGKGMEDLATICRICRAVGGLIKCGPKSGPDPIPRPSYPPRPSPPSLPAPAPPSPPSPEEEEEHNDEEKEEKEPEENEPEESEEEKEDGYHGRKKGGAKEKDEAEGDDGGAEEGKGGKPGSYGKEEEVEAVEEEVEK